MSNGALDSEDFVLLLLAVDLLDQHTGDELAKARSQGNATKTAAMLNMRARLIIVRGKLLILQQSGQAAAQTCPAHPRVLSGAGFCILGDVPILERTDPKEKWIVPLLPCSVP